jgi:predicted dehydrogenase
MTQETPSAGGPREGRAPAGGAPRVGVIGAGKWGGNIIRTLSEMGALASVAEVSAPGRDVVRARHPDVRLHADHRALLEEDCAAVAVVTPAPSHYEIAREALLAGKDVFVEKPFTLTTGDAESLVALAEARGRVLMAGHLLLHQPALIALKERVDAGDIGRLASIHVERLNLGTARPVENALESLGVHDVALFHFIVGAPATRVDAVGQGIVRSSVEDDVYLHLDFASGVRAHIHASWLWPEKRRSLVAVGTEGMLVYDEVVHTVELRRKGIRADLSNRDEGAEVVARGSTEPLRLELEHFVERVRDRKAPRSDGRSAVAVVRVIEEASHLLAAARARRGEGAERGP